MKISTVFKILFLFGSSNLLSTANPKIPVDARPDLILGDQDAYRLGISAKSISSPNSVVIEPSTGKVFVSDTFQNRILRYKNVASLVNAAEAEEVIGQVRLDQGNPSGGAQGLRYPQGIFLDRFGRLWVADSGNNRVVMYQSASSRTFPILADRVFGQPNLEKVDISYPLTPTSTSINNPTSVCLDKDDRLWVADSGNSRVLRFDNVSLKNNGAAADGVLCQSNFSSISTTIATPSFSNPTRSVVSGIAISSSGSLFVAQQLIHRVIRFDNAASLPNGANPSAVLGQPNFSSNPITGSSLAQMYEPYGITITPDDTLWVLDSRNSRVTRFASASTKPDGAFAEGFVRTENYGLEATPYIDNQSKLWIPSFRDVRRYSADEKKPTVSVTTKIEKTPKIGNIVLKGKASDDYGIRNIQYSINNGTLKIAQGTLNWKITTKLKFGKNKISIFATDSVGNVSVTRSLTIIVKKSKRSK
jgi:sugar lactone lactonase YvrE